MSKINKLGKSTFVIAILSFLLVAVLAFGGTYAYFSATSGEAVKGNITTGHLVIDTVKGTGTTGELKASATLAQPNQTIFNETVTTTVMSNIAYFTRVNFSVNIYEEDGVTPVDMEGHDGHVDSVTKAVEILTITGDKIGYSGETGKEWQNGVEGNTIDYSAETVTFYKLKPTKDGVNVTTGTKEEFKFNVVLNAWVGLETAGDAAGCDFWMDKVVEVSITVDVLQADYLLDLDQAAADDGFDNGKEAADAWAAALAVNQTTDIVDKA